MQVIFTYANVLKTANLFDRDTQTLRFFIHTPALGDLNTLRDNTLSPNKYLEEHIMKNVKTLLPLHHWPLPSFRYPLLPLTGAVLPNNF